MPISHRVEDDVLLLPEKVATLDLFVVTASFAARKKRGSAAKYACGVICPRRRLERDQFRNSACTSCRPSFSVFVGFTRKRIACRVLGLVLISEKGDDPRKLEKESSCRPGEKHIFYFPKYINFDSHRRFEGPGGIFTAVAVYEFFRALRRLPQNPTSRNHSSSKKKAYDIAPAQSARPCRPCVMRRNESRFRVPERSG